MAKYRAIFIFLLSTALAKGTEKRNANSVVDLFSPPGETFWSNYQSALNYFRKSVESNGIGGGGGGGDQFDTGSLEQGEQNLLSAHKKAGSTTSQKQEAAMKEALLKVFKENNLLGNNNRVHGQDRSSSENYFDLQATLPKEKDRFGTPLDPALTEEPESGMEDKKPSETEEGNIRIPSNKRPTGTGGIGLQALSESETKPDSFDFLLKKENDSNSAVDSIVASVFNITQSNETISIIRKAENVTTTTAAPFTRPPVRQVVRVVHAKPGPLIFPIEKPSAAPSGDSSSPIAINTAANRYVLQFVDAVNTVGVISSVMALPFLIPAIFGKKRRRRSISEDHEKRTYQISGNIDETSTISLTKY